MRKIEKENPGEETGKKMLQVGSEHWGRKQHWVHYGPGNSRVKPEKECWRDEILGGGDRGDRGTISPEKHEELMKLSRGGK